MAVTSFFTDKFFPSFPQTKLSIGAKMGDFLAVGGSSRPPTPETRAPHAQRAADVTAPSCCTAPLALARRLSSQKSTDDDTDARRPPPLPTQLFLSSESRARAWHARVTLGVRAARAARTPGRQGFLRFAALSSDDERQRERTRALSHGASRRPGPSGVRSGSASSEPRGVASEGARVELRAAPSRVQQRTVRLLKNLAEFLQKKCASLQEAYAKSVS